MSSESARFVNVSLSPGGVVDPHGALLALHNLQQHVRYSSLGARDELDQPSKRREHEVFVGLREQRFFSTAPGQFDHQLSLVAPGPASDAARMLLFSI